MPENEAKESNPIHSYKNPSINKKKFNFGFLKEKNKLFAIAFVLVVIPLTIILALNSQDVRKKAAENSEVNLISLSDDLIQNGSADVQVSRSGARTMSSNVEASTVSKSKQRKDLMLKLAKDDPQQFMLNALPSKVTKNFSPVVAENVEKEVKVEGKFVAIHYDDFKNKKDKYIYRIEQYDGKKLKKAYNLNFASPIAAINSDSTVTVSGYVLDNQLVIAGGGGPGSGLSVIDPSRLSTTGEQKTLIMLINFKDDPTQFIDKGDIRKRFFEQANSLKNFYKENSYEKADFTGDVVGYYTVPFNNVNCDANVFDWSNAADAIAYSRGIDIDAYARHVYMFSSRDCGFGGLGTIAGNPSKSWIPHGASESINAHELGHNLGVHHANTIFCGDKAVAENIWECSSLEYNDPTDVMGYRYFQFNGPHKEEVGWLNDNQILAVNSDTTISVVSLESNVSGTKLVKIPIPTSYSYYYLSYRRPLGFDATLPTQFTNGASLHLWQKGNDVYDSSSSQTNLVNTNPTGNSYEIENSAMKDGQTFADNYNGITIKQLSHDSEKVNMEIKIDKSVCRRGVPIAFINPLSNVGNAGEAKTYQITLTNTDSLSCSPTVFNFYGSVPKAAHQNEWSITFSPEKPEISPGQTTTITQKVTSSYREPLGIKLIATFINSSEPRHSIQLKSNYIVYGNLNYVNVSPGQIETTVGDEAIGMSAMAYDENYQQIREGVTFEWSMSSDNSIGGLESEAGKINRLSLLKAGFGEITIKATYNGSSIFKTVPVKISSKSTSGPTPSAPLTPAKSPTPTPSPTPKPENKIVILKPTADTFVKSNQINKNFGTLSNIDSVGSPVTIGLFKFNLSSLAGKTIVKATLNLHVSDASVNSQTLQRGNDKSWSETTVSYSTRPTSVSTIRTFNAGAVGQTLSLLVANPVNVKKGSAITFMISSAGTDRATYYSREAGSSLAPTLTVEYK